MIKASNSISLGKSIIFHTKNHENIYYSFTFPETYVTWDLSIETLLLGSDLITRRISDRYQIDISYINNISQISSIDIGLVYHNGRKITFNISQSTLYDNPYSENPNYISSYQIIDTEIKPIIGLKASYNRWIYTKASDYMIKFGAQLNYMFSYKTKYYAVPEYTGINTTRFRYRIEKPYDFLFSIIILKPVVREKSLFQYLRNYFCYR